MLPLTDTRVSHWPHLTYHYGISPVELARLPRWLVRLYVETLPELLAQRQLHALESAAFPHLTDRAREKTLDYWQERAYSSEGDAPRQQAPLVEQAAALAGMGIGFVMEDEDA